MRRQRRVQITIYSAPVSSVITSECSILTPDAGEFSQVVYNDLTRVYMVVDERQALFRSVPAQYGYTSKAESCGPKNQFTAV
jgi:hypothetical protein